MVVEDAFGELDGYVCKTVGTHHSNGDVLRDLLESVEGDDAFSEEGGCLLERDGGREEDYLTGVHLDMGSKSCLEGTLVDAGVVNPHGLAHLP